MTSIANADREYIACGRTIDRNIDMVNDAADAGTTVRFTYTNNKGETTRRDATPVGGVFETQGTKTGEKNLAWWGDTDRGRRQFLVMSMVRTFDKGE